MTEAAEAVRARALKKIAAGVRRLEDLVGWPVLNYVNAVSDAVSVLVETPDARLDSGPHWRPSRHLMPPIPPEIGLMLVEFALIRAPGVESWLAMRNYWEHNYRIDVPLSDPEVDALIEGAGP